MKVYTHPEHFRNVTRPIITTGTFDGVHQGHLHIIRRLKEIAAVNGGETVVFTFSPHPRLVLFPDDQKLRLLNTQSEKISLLEKAGVDHLIIYPFTKAFSRLTAVEYVRDILVNQLHIHRLVIGYDHQFGRNREGSITNLQELAPLYGFEVEEIPAQMVDDVNVSSTKIRQSLQEGDIESANQFLGYSYPLSGIVISGQQIGRSIGFPTANIQVTEPLKLIPGDGVYAVKISHKGKAYGGMLNIGIKPTLELEHPNRTLEVNIFDFEGELYNEMIQLEFIARIREEKKFLNLDQLKLQLHEDRLTAQKLLLQS
ncbi:MAG: bifunctional riboflavin kinase/FAD synthetase [Flavobacteriales bacterium]|nr:bifunctional riboflavin kinase/FAD synthetase [Flavobacteriales bacterium]